MFCKNCGVKLDLDAKFCSNCGIALTSNGETHDDSNTTTENGFASLTIKRNNSFLGCAIATGISFNGLHEIKIANNSMMKYQIKSGIVSVNLNQMGYCPVELKLRIRPDSEPVITFSVVQEN